MLSAIARIAEVGGKDCATGGMIFPAQERIGNRGKCVLLRNIRQRLFLGILLYSRTLQLRQVQVEKRLADIGLSARALRSHQPSPWQQHMHFGDFAGKYLGSAVCAIPGLPQESSGGAIGLSPAVAAACAQIVASLALSRRGACAVCVSTGGFVLLWNAGVLPYNRLGVDEKLIISSRSRR